MRPSSVFRVPVRSRYRFRLNDTSEITSVLLRASQAEICYWVRYSLCGTKAVRKVFKSA
ncbi:hypothetical protein SHJG_4501 [Streptomyces hygroscopicus subsp. jinggangensis 5008]|nr:hypothetical protein SHJG_4501 [Streptomyces hygroscopicus subsp. jinggangensis 5008]AGF63929.1 hypothetical protein SHJGH_4264 [Streptomyces hygroscopicus subsp. jinggangensis TL01]